jgi:hypothetical protein
MPDGSQILQTGAELTVEDCMIEEPCRTCGRVWCVCTPEPQDPLEAYTLDEISLFMSDPEDAWW